MDTKCVEQTTAADAAILGGDAGGSGSGSGSGSDPNTVSVHVTVEGPGKVTASTGAVCSTDCMFDVDKGVPLTLTATASSGNQNFVGWSGACVAQLAQCHVTPITAITAGAKFMGGG